MASPETCLSFHQPNLPQPPYAALERAATGARKNLTLLIFADSVHRIGLTSFCHEAKGKLDRGDFAGFAKGDVKGMALQCRIRMSGYSMLRIVYVSSFGVPPDPPYHYKYLGNQASTWFRKSGSPANASTLPELLEHGTVRRFATTVSLLEAASTPPDVVLVASGLWDMARMEELGRGPGAWVPWVHVRGQSWPRSSRVEAYFGSRRNRSASGGVAAAAAAASTAARDKFITEWQANATALLLAIRSRLHRHGSGALVVWQANPTLPDFYSAAVSRFMASLNQAAEHAVADANAAGSNAALHADGRAHLPSCRIGFLDAEKLLRAGEERKWWGASNGYATCCQDGYGHLRPRVMRSLCTCHRA